MKITKWLPLFLAILTSNSNTYAQVAPFEIKIEPLSVSELGGIQSYAFGQDNGKWLIVGGRLDGLHRRQPWAAFDLAGHNNQLIVVDPITQQKWTAPLTSLSTSIQEHLRSTNMEFFQEGDYLYCLGGYGYSSVANGHTTFDKLTAISVPDVISAVINASNFTSYFRQITDSNFQVTGGRLKKINETWYLMGGQKFLGSYNPMGPDHGPGFIQEYTNAIRKFNLNDNGTEISINHLTPFIDTVNLHRRDYNAEQQILPDGSEGLTMFSGVFQYNANLPFLNSVTVDSNSYAVNNTFQQHYNHYHCPVLPIYSQSSNEMHSVFFGGIAQYYDNAGTLVQDNNVPFVNTIARVTRDANGILTEYKLPIEMPALLGSGAEFIPNLDIPHYHNEVFKLDSLSPDSTLIGYIYGGISSSQPNIFFINDGNQSSASSMIYKVYVKKSSPLSVDKVNLSSISPLKLTVYPNPNEGSLNISFQSLNNEDITLSIIDAKGLVIDKEIIDNIQIGSNHYQKQMNGLSSGSVYFIQLENSDHKATRKLIVQ